jgi:hypothetical protein
MRLVQTTVIELRTFLCSAQRGVIISVFTNPTIGPLADPDNPILPPTPWFFKIDINTDLLSPISLQSDLSSPS